MRWSSGAAERGGADRGSIATTGSIPGSARSMSRRSSTARGGSRRRLRGGAGARGPARGTSLRCRCSCTGSWPAGARARELRRGGPAELARGCRPASWCPTSGPRAHPTAGAVLVAARPPLVAFNVELRPPATLEQARAIAARDPRGRRRGPARRPRDRPVAGRTSAWPRSRPTSRTSRHPAGRRWSRRSPGTPSRRRPSWSGWRREAAFEGFPEQLALRGRATIEDALAAPARNLQGPHGTDQAQAPQQTPGHGRRNDRGSRPHRPSAEPAGAQEADP